MQQQNGQPNEPGITITGAPEVEIASDMTATVWNLSAAGVKELTTKLYVVRDGASEVIQESTYVWEDETPGAGNWQLTYFPRIGAHFGAMDEMIPTYFIDFAGPEYNTRMRSASPTPIKGKLTPSTAMSSNDATISPEGSFVYLASLEPEGTNTEVEYGNSLESMEAAATDGRIFVALEVSWKPVE